MASSALERRDMTSVAPPPPPRASYRRGQEFARRGHNEWPLSRQVPTVLWDIYQNVFKDHDQLVEIRKATVRFTNEQVRSCTIVNTWFIIATALQLSAFQNGDFVDE